jgi:signal transduction histidine kinase/DNA-binding LytR/AlgR family response regulator
MVDGKIPGTLNILLIDGDPQVEAAATASLREDSARVIRAVDGLSGMALARLQPFDLIVLDVHLPDFSGWEILRQLRADDSLARVPALLLGAWDDLPKPGPGFPAGHLDCLPKPIETRAFRNRVLSLLQLRQLEEELASARRQCESSSRIRSEYLANMSHEIRTPMNAVVAMTSLLLNTTLTAEQHEIVNTIRASSDALLTLLNDVLDLAKIEAGRLELEVRPFELRRCVEETVDLFAVKAGAKHLDLICQIEDNTPSMLLGDVTRVRQILANLVSNAVKFTAKGEVVVHVSAQPVSPTTIDQWEFRFQVRDTGVGIQPEKMGRLFASFAQLDSAASQPMGGHGLGLAISKNLAEMMGGSLHAESRPGQGSTFTFNIRAQTAPSSFQPPIVKTHSQLKDLRLLIVDDNATNRQILVLQGRKWGMIPRDTAHGAEALEWLRNGEPFDIGILDMQMPDMDGVTLAAEMRKLRNSQSLPLILLTSMGLWADLPKPSLEPFAVCLDKPVKQAQLQEVLLRVLTGGKPEAPNPAPVPRFDTTLGQRLPLRLLLADDNLVNQKVASRLFQQMGYQADFVLNGLEAVEAVKQKGFDIVFMDVQMPVMDGLEATRQIRQYEREQYHLTQIQPQTVIIAMTANALRGDRERCLAAGMDDYISKPVRPETIQAVIERWGAVLVGKRQSQPPASEPDHPSARAEAAGVAKPPVDVGRLLQFAAGDWTTLREIVDVYLNQTTAQLAALRTAVTAGRAAEVGATAHKCAGASATCGMNIILPSLRELERQGRSGRLEDAESLVETAGQSFQTIRVFLDQYFKENQVDLGKPIP